MVNFIFRFAPEWFYLTEISLDILSLIACMLIAFFALRMYGYTKQSKHRHFGYSFLAIALSFFIKILTNLVSYFPTVKAQTVKIVSVMYNSFTITYTPVKLALFVNRSLMLLGLFGIFYIVSKSKERNKIPLFVYFTLLTAAYVFFDVLGPNSYRIFYVTTAFLSLFILRYYHAIYKKNKNKKTLLIFESFLFIFLGQIVALLTFIDIIGLNAYVLGQILQFIGFLLLICNYYLLQK